MKTDIASDQDKLKAAEQHVKQGRLDEALALLENLSTRSAVRDEKQLRERAEDLNKRIEKIKGLRVSRRILVFTTLIVSALLAFLMTFRTWSTVVDAEVQADRVIFTSAEPFEIGPIRARRVSMSGATYLLLGHAKVQSPGHAGNPGNVSSKETYRIEGKHPLWSIDLKGAYLKIASLQVGENAEVVMESDSRRPGRLKIIITGADIEGSLDTGNTLDSTCNACFLLSGSSRRDLDGVPLRYTLPEEQIGFSSKKGQLIIDVDTVKDKQDASYLESNTRIRIKSLAFRRLRGERTESSIVGRGRIKLISLGGKEIPLNSGQVLQVGKLQDFELEGVSLQKYLTVRGYGNVGLLETGYPHYVKNGLPSFLAWLRVNQTVNLYLGVLISALSIILAALHRLKILEEG